MRKWIGFFCALMMVLGLVACSKSETNPTESNESTPIEQTEQAEQTEASTESEPTIVPVVVVTVNEASADLTSWLLNEVGITHVPAYVFLKDGKVVNVIENEIDVQQFQDALQNNTRSVDLWNGTLESNDNSSLALNEYDVLYLYADDDEVCEAHQKENQPAIYDSANGLKILECKIVIGNAEIDPSENESSATELTWTVTKPATCTELGEEQAIDETGEIVTRSIAMLEHTYENKVVAPTKDSDGYTQHTCKVCGYSYKDNYTGSIETWGDWTVKSERITKEATCASTGEKQVTYTRTSNKNNVETKIETELIPVSKEHVGGATVKDAKKATTTSTGYTGDKYCDTCGKLIEKGTTIAKLDDSKPAHTHSYNASWLWNGYASAQVTFKCSDCGEYEIKNASISSKVTQEPTTEKTGERTYTATVIFNGKTYTDTKKETIDKLVENHTHSYGTPSWSWNGYNSATATFKCSCGDVQTKTATISYETTKQPTTTSQGEKTYTATVTFNGKTYTNDKKETLDKLHSHSYNNPTWNWNGYASATATFTCTAKDDTQKVNATITSKVTKEATTAQTGTKVYTATVTFAGKTYTNDKTETLPKLAHTHSYGNPTWSWSGYAAASVVFKCIDGDDTKTVNATVTSKVTKEPTTSENGIRTYTATVTFNGKTYTNNKTESIAKVHSHTYGNPTWTWSGYTSATAKFTCTSGDDTQTKTATITSEVTKQPTTTSTGIKTYTASVTFNGKTYTDQKKETLAKLSHNHTYGSPTWNWNGYGSATAIFTCTDKDDTQKVNATITSGVTKAATCESTGTKIYTATVTFGGKTYTDTKTETLSKLGHNYGNPTWNWVNYDFASITVTCSNCGDKRSTQGTPTGTITKQPTETETGTKVWTITLTLEGKSYTDTKTEILPKLESAEVWEEILVSPNHYNTDIYDYLQTAAGKADSNYKLLRTYYENYSFIDYGTTTSGYYVTYYDESDTMHTGTKHTAEFYRNENYPEDDFNYGVNYYTNYNTFATQCQKNNTLGSAGTCHYTYDKPVTIKDKVYVYNHRVK